MSAETGKIDDHDSQKSAPNSCIYPEILTEVVRANLERLIATHDQPDLA